MDKETSTGTPGSDPSKLGKAKEFVNQKYTAASDSVKSGYDAAAESAKSAYGAASEKVKDRYTAVKGKIDEIDFDQVTDQVRGYVRSNPGKALLISVGIGFVFGMLMRRGDDD